MIEFICAVFVITLMAVISTLVPIIFSVVLLYIVWRILKKKEWV